MDPGNDDFARECCVLAEQKVMLNQEEDWKMEGSWGDGQGEEV
jgi:hypothetical protein